MLAQTGWQRIGPDPRIARWAEAALPLAVASLASDPAPLRAGGTWAVGLDLLANDAAGRVGGIDFPWGALPLDPVPLHRGQLSAVHPGYPAFDPLETPAQARFRRARDGAHLDGVLAVGPGKDRMVKEPHAWILGLPLTRASGSPLVVWEGSVAILRRALLAELEGHPPASWDEVALTEAYRVARARVFETCRRVELRAAPGEAILLHRLCLHGVAPWGEADEAPPEGRIIAYFRPLMASVRDWILQP